MMPTSSTQFCQSGSDPGLSLVERFGRRVAVHSGESEVGQVVGREHMYVQMRHLEPGDQQAGPLRPERLGDGAADALIVDRFGRLPDPDPAVDAEEPGPYRMAAAAVPAAGVMAAATADLPASVDVVAAPAAAVIVVCFLPETLVRCCATAASAMKPENTVLAYGDSISVLGEPPAL